MYFTATRSARSVNATSSLCKLAAMKKLCETTRTTSNKPPLSPFVFCRLINGQAFSLQRHYTVTVPGYLWTGTGRITVVRRTAILCALPDYERCTLPSTVLSRSWASRACRAQNEGGSDDYSSTITTAQAVRRMVRRATIHNHNPQANKNTVIKKEV